MRRSIEGDSIPTDPEIERTFHRRLREAVATQQKDQKEQVSMENQQLNPAPLANAEVEDEGNRLLGDFMAPFVVQSQSSIVYPPFGQPNFQLKTNVIHLFQNGHQFHGMATENPHTHISRFLDMCQHFRYQGISEDAIKLRLFPHTLRDKALEWLDSLSIASITTWDELAHRFCTKFFSPAKVAQMRHAISVFTQNDSESFDEVWNRFKNMLRKCPQHGFDKKTQIRFFYTGLLPSFRSMVDSSSNGSLTTRTIDGAWELFERMADTSAMWSSERVVQKKSVGIYEVDTYSALSAKIDSLFHKVESISHSANAAQARKSNCEECGAEHSTKECPILSQGVEQADYAQWGQRQQNNPNSDTYNPGWRNHQNFSWRGDQNKFHNQNQPQGQFQQEKKIQLEEILAKFMEKTDKYMEKTEIALQNQGAAIKNLETQVGQIALAINGRAPGTLPSNTEVNPREQCQAITTRSGIQLPETTVKRPSANKDTLSSSEKEKAEQTKETSPREGSDTSQNKAPAPVNPYDPPIPFPQRLKKYQWEQQYKKFLEVFTKLHINVPFVEALFKMPSYAKFLKDILSKKRKLEEHETVMLTEECSALIQKKLPPKLKDPGSFTIPCIIGGCYFDKALCDLGASINLMPLSVFRKLGLGDAKATTVTLQLADRSLVHPRGIIEDVLIKVDKFIFPADFLILDMEEDKNVPLILGRPFLATSRALIDVQKGQLNLRLGEEQITFNVFKNVDFHTEPEKCLQMSIVENVVKDKTSSQDHSNTVDDYNVHAQPTQNYEKNEAYFVEFKGNNEGKSDKVDRGKVKVWRKAAVRKKSSLEELLSHHRNQTNTV